jgi:hypothetical protein
LLSDSARFFEHGRAYQLLQEYFAGFPVETLRPLLGNNDSMVRRAAVWVASELGRNAQSLIRDAVPLINDNDRYIRYHALEIVMVCSFGENVHEFVHVVRALESDDEVIRVLAMRLVSNAHDQQLEAAVRRASSLGPLCERHETCLSDLLEAERVTPLDIVALLDHEQPLARRYGAIAAKRLSHNFPAVLDHALSNADPDVRQFFHG